LKKKNKFFGKRKGKRETKVLKKDLHKVRLQNEEKK